MIHRAAYPARIATRAPHPTHFLRRHTGPFGPNQPCMGRLRPFGGPGESVINQRFLSHSGSIGSLGSKSTTSTRATNIAGLGVDFWVRVEVSALGPFDPNGPDPPNSAMITVGYVFQALSGLDPPSMQFGPIGPAYPYRNQDFVLQRKETTRSS